MADDGLTQAKRWTDALWGDRMESLLHLSEAEMTRLFSTAPTFEFLLDTEMSVVDLVKKVRPKFRDGKQSMPVIQKITVDCNDHKILDRSVLKTGNP